MSKYGPEITPYLDTFHEVLLKYSSITHGTFEIKQQKQQYVSTSKTNQGKTK